MNIKKFEELIDFKHFKFLKIFISLSFLFFLLIIFWMNSENVANKLIYYSLFHDEFEDR